MVLNCKDKDTTIDEVPVSDILEKIKRTAIEILGKIKVLGEIDYLCGILHCFLGTVLIVLKTERLHGKADSPNWQALLAARK